MRTGRTCYPDSSSQRAPGDGPFCLPYSQGDNCATPSSGGCLPSLVPRVVAGPGDRRWFSQVQPAQRGFCPTAVSPLLSTAHTAGLLPGTPATLCASLLAAAGRRRGHFHAPEQPLLGHSCPSAHCRAQGWAASSTGHCSLQVPSQHLHPPQHRETCRTYVGGGLKTRTQAHPWHWHLLSTSPGTVGAQQGNHPWPWGHLSRTRGLLGVLCLDRPLELEEFWDYMASQIPRLSTTLAQQTVCNSSVLLWPPEGKGNNKITILSHQFLPFQLFPEPLNSVLILA